MTKTGKYKGSNRVMLFLNVYKESFFYKEFTLLTKELRVSQQRAIKEAIALWIGVNKRIIKKNREKYNKKDLEL